MGWHCGQVMVSFSVVMSPRKRAEREVTIAAATDSLLSDNDRKEALSLAYLAVLAAKAGYVSARSNFDRDSIDMLIRAGGGNYPQIGIQAKATATPRWMADGLHFQLGRKNYDDLRAVRMIPAVLTVLELPADEADWLTCSPAELVLRRSTWWLSLRGFPEIEGDFRVVILPQGQRLDPTSLVELMQRARDGDL